MMHEHVVHGTFGQGRACPLFHEDQNKEMIQGIRSVVETIPLADRIYVVLIVDLTGI